MESWEKKTRQDRLVFVRNFQFLTFYLIWPGLIWHCPFLRPNLKINATIEFCTQVVHKSCVAQHSLGHIKIQFSLIMICLGPRSVPVGAGCVLLKYFLNWCWLTGPAQCLNIAIILQWHHHQKSGTIQLTNHATSKSLQATHTHTHTHMSSPNHNELSGICFSPVSQLQD